jgi:hypothetical protein
MLDEAIYRFRQDEQLFPSHIVLIRVHLRNWIDAPALDRSIERTMLDALRRDVRRIEDKEGISLWLSRAEEFGLDPL